MLHIADKMLRVLVCAAVVTMGLLLFGMVAA